MIRELFHRLANEGDAIRDYRKENPYNKHLEAWRIELLIKIEKLKKFFNT